MSKRLQSGHCTDALCLAVKTNAFLKTKMCPKLDTCTLGKNCSFAHSEKELRPLPEFKKTAICYNYRRGRCFDPRCKFAHGEEDMMGYVPEPAVQTRKICPYYIVGACSNPNCGHAHLHSRRAASRLKTFLLSLRNALSTNAPFGDSPVSLVDLKKKLKGGIPWQTLGFSSFEEAILFLPGTELSPDEQFVVLHANAQTRNLLQTLHDLVDSSPQAVHLEEEPKIPTTSDVYTPIRSFGRLLTSTINPETQVVCPSSDSVDFFTCPVCQGLSVDPLIAVKCSHVMCAACFELWKNQYCGSASCIVCPKCYVELTSGDIDPVSTDSPHTTSAALGVIYDAIQVRCESCPWTGSPRDYPKHECRENDEEKIVTLATANKAYDPSILAVEEGELLEVSAESESGWAFVTKPHTNVSGWTPTANLREPTFPEHEKYTDDSPNLSATT